MAVRVEVGALELRVVRIEDEVVAGRLPVNQITRLVA